jgi:hypothetical protein
MAQNFLSCDRDQPLLLPPDLRDWVPQDHLAWFVIEAIDELDLEPFYAAYRSDGHGRAASVRSPISQRVLLRGVATAICGAGAASAGAPLLDRRSQLGPTAEGEAATLGGAQPALRCPYLQVHLELSSRSVRAFAHIASIRTRTRQRARPSQAGLAARPPERSPEPLDRR